MAKKSSALKKLNPILKEANNLKNQNNYEDAVRKFREGISFITNSPTGVLIVLSILSPNFFICSILIHY